jgi:type I restriction enzyme S subunit
MFGGKGYESFRLDEVCEMNMGQSPDSKSYNEENDGLPFFQGNADFGELYPSPRFWCTQPTKVAHKGDILISVRAPIGALNLATEKCCIGRGLAALTAKPNKINRIYLYYILQEKADDLISRGTGTTFLAINKAALAATMILLPPLALQHRFADFAETADKSKFVVDEVLKITNKYGIIIANHKIGGEHSV